MLGLGAVVEGSIAVYDIMNTPIMREHMMVRTASAALRDFCGYLRSAIFSLI